MHPRRLIASLMLLTKPISPTSEMKLSSLQRTKPRWNMFNATLLISPIFTISMMMALQCKRPFRVNISRLAF